MVSSGFYLHLTDTHLTDILKRGSIIQSSCSAAERKNGQHTRAFFNKIQKNLSSVQVKCFFFYFKNIIRVKINFIF